PAIVLQCEACHRSSDGSRWLRPVCCAACRCQRSDNCRHHEERCFHASLTQGDIGQPETTIVAFIAAGVNSVYGPPGYGIYGQRTFQRIGPSACTCSAEDGPGWPFPADAAGSWAALAVAGGVVVGTSAAGPLAPRQNCQFERSM